VQPLDLSALSRDLEQQMLGQPEVVEIITRTISLIKSGLSDMRRPFGVFLFAGPTGVGKTHTAQLLAQHLFGSRERMIRLNMGDYQSEQAPQILFGDPSDYRLPLRQGLVTQSISGQPFAVLLLDEFEKAHEKVADRFLQLFDEGSFMLVAAEGLFASLETKREEARRLLEAMNVPGFWETSLARTYGKDGVGARDPRTGATALRIKDVLRGNLDPFFEAWRTQAASG
jgi:hypothetical protein